MATHRAFDSLGAMRSPDTIGRTHRRRQLALTALALGCAVVMVTRVHDGYSRIRVRPLSASQVSVGGLVTVDLPSLPLLGTQPASVVLNLTNPTGVSQSLTIDLNGTPMASRTLATGGSRLDLRVPPGSLGSDPNRIALRSPGDGWSLAQLEIGNAYGFSTGLFEMVIAPAGTTNYPAPGGWMTAALVLLLIGLAARPPRPFQSRLARQLHHGLSGLVLVVFTALLALPFVSIYLVIFSERTFLWCLAVLYAPALEAVRRRVVPVAIAWIAELSQQAFRRRHAIVCSLLVVLFVVCIRGFYDPENGFTRLIGFGSQFDAQALPALRAVPHHLEVPAGYDGQFYAQLALDPLARDPAIEEALDNFAYRARRILFAWTAYAGGLGQPAWIVSAYALQNVACWLVLAVLLWRWLPPVSFRHVWLWFACLFSDGLISSVRDALLEGPGLLLLALTIVAIERRRTWLATALAAASPLGRETNVLGAVTLVDRVPRTVADWTRLLAQGLAVVVPLLLWIGYLQRSHPSSMLEAGYANFAWPFSAWAADWAGALPDFWQGGWQSIARFDVLALTDVTVQAIALLTWRRWESPWYRAGVAYVVLMAVLGPAVWEGTPGAFTRILVPMTFAFNILLARSRSVWFWPAALLGNLSVLHALEMLRTPYIWQYL